MRQGEIWSVYFDPTKGSEQSGNRPAVIMSGNTMNTNSNLLIVCPLTTSIHRFEGNPIIEPSDENGLTKESEILVFHIRTLSKLRFKKKIGSINKSQLKKAVQTLNEILKY